MGKLQIHEQRFKPEDNPYWWNIAFDDGMLIECGPFFETEDLAREAAVQFAKEHGIELETE